MDTFLGTFSPLVKFCGYSLPHPNEKQVLMQIQVYPGRGITARDALEKGLTDLKEATNCLKSKFHVSNIQSVKIMLALNSFLIHLHMYMHVTS